MKTCHSLVSFNNLLVCLHFTDSIPESLNQNKPQSQNESRNQTLIYWISAMTERFTDSSTDSFGETGVSLSLQRVKRFTDSNTDSLESWFPGRWLKGFTDSNTEFLNLWAKHLFPEWERSESQCWKHEQCSTIQDKQKAPPSWFSSHFSIKNERD